MAREHQPWLRLDRPWRETPANEPRTKPAGERKAELLDAAAELVAEQGVEKLTIDAVTTGAGVAKGTFYLHFETKDALLQALRDRLGDEILERHERSLVELDPDDHAGRLDRWMIDAIWGRVDRAELRDALFHRQRAAGSVDTSVVVTGAHVAMLTDVLRAGVDAGDFAIDDVDTTAILLYGAMHSGVDALLDGHGPEAIERLVVAARRIARRAVGLHD